MKIKIEGLSKYFQAGKITVLALSDINLAVAEGQFVCIVGPSGCGKTTLLRIVAELENPTTGKVKVERTNHSRPVNSMIFQENSTFPWLTVKENIEYGLKMRGIEAKKRSSVSEYYMDKVGLSRFARCYPYQLSGGMKQRVSIARAFANDPEIFLMDEPFASLDEQTKYLLQEELLSIWAETRKTVLYITHSIDEAIVLGDRVILLTAQPGRIKAEIQVDVPRPRSLYDVRSSAKYSELTKTIWTLLRDEVMRAKELERRSRDGADSAEKCDEE